MQGFGFVTYASSVSAESARLAMNGAVVEGRKIEVQQPFYLHAVFTMNNLLLPTSFCTHFWLSNSVDSIVLPFSLCDRPSIAMILLLCCSFHSVTFLLVSHDFVTVWSQHDSQISDCLLFIWLEPPSTQWYILIFFCCFLSPTHVCLLYPVRLSVHLFINLWWRCMLLIVSWIKLTELIIL